MEGSEEDYGAFMEKFILTEPIPDSATACPSPPQSLPLQGLTFAVKSIFDVEGYVTSFGHPEWAATHPPAKSTASAVQALLKAGASCLGITVMDEMAYSVNGENIHYGTPRNPCAIGHVPGGSSSGSAVAVAANIADFSLGTDTGGSVRVPASYCGIFGFRPSHGVDSVEGVIPFAQSFDTVGWFARDPVILSRVGDVLLPSIPDGENNNAIKPPAHILIADDCFQLSTIPVQRVMGVVVESIKKLFGGDIVIKHLIMGDYVKNKVPSLTHFETSEDGEYIGDDINMPSSSLVALASVNSISQRYELNKSHGQWITTINPKLDPRIMERVSAALKTTEEGGDLRRSVMTELHDALTSLIGDDGVLAIPTVVDPPPKLKMDVATTARKRAYGPLSIAGLSGFCQVSIPLGMHDDLPVSISLVAKHGLDKFLLNFTRNIYGTLKEQSALAEKSC